MSVEQYPDVVMPECPAEKILQGQKALVTGGASGIGRAVAIALGKAGADVVVNYVRGEDQANEVAAEIRKCGNRAYAHKADVSSEEQVKNMYQKMFKEFGTIDILINNAGLQKDAPFDEMTVDQWNIVINVNLTGQFLCAREAVREFKRRGVVEAVSCAAGKIICMSSVHETIPWASHVNYAASKNGVMLNAGVFHHVLDAHPFKNEDLFYRFVLDEDHGSVARKPDGSAVSWADFMAPLTSADDKILTFQPKIPERDPNLASFDQVDIEPAVSHHSMNTTPTC